MFSVAGTNAHFFNRDDLAYPASHALYNFGSRVDFLEIAHFSIQRVKPKLQTHPSVRPKALPFPF